MGLELVEAARPEGVDPRVVPDIGPRTAMAPELDIVEMRLLADAEHPDELMLAPVERALAGVRFHPDRSPDGRSASCDGLPGPALQCQCPRHRGSRTGQA